GLVAAAALAVAPAAMAGSARCQAQAVVTSGACSGASTWKLTLKKDSATKIEADLEVQSNASGQTWKYTMKDNGTRFAKGTSTTAADGSFSVSRLATNQAGSDLITVKSTNLTTLEVCNAAGTF